MAERRSGKSERQTCPCDGLEAMWVMVSTKLAGQSLAAPLAGVASRAIQGLFVALQEVQG